MDKIEKGPTLTIAEFEKRTGTSQPTSRMLFDYADALRLVGRRRDSAAVYDSLDLTTVPQKKRWLVPLYRGVLHREAGDYAAAESSFRSSITRNPTSTVPWIHLASSLALQEKFEDAVAVLRGGEDLQGDQDELQLNLALSLRSLGRLSEAESSLRKALSITPDYPEALEELEDIVAALEFLKQ